MQEHYIAYVYHSFHKLISIMNAMELLVQYNSGTYILVD